MNPFPYPESDYPNAAALVNELVQSQTINPTAFYRPHPLSEDCIRNLEEGGLPRRDFVWLMQARESEFKRADYNRARREELLKEAGRGK